MWRVGATGSQGPRRGVVVAGSAQPGRAAGARNKGPFRSIRQASRGHQPRGAGFRLEGRLLAPLRMAVAQPAVVQEGRFKRVFPPRFQKPSSTMLLALLVRAWFYGAR